MALGVEPSKRGVALEGPEHRRPVEVRVVPLVRGKPSATGIAVRFPGS